MKLCKDCRHAVEPENGKERSWICSHRSARYQEISPVTGELIVEQVRCKTARVIGECRTEANYWAPKDEPTGGFI